MRSFIANPFSMLNVPRILKPTFENPKSGNSTFRVANTKPILKLVFSCSCPNPVLLGGQPGSMFPYDGCATKLRLSSRSSGSTVFRKRNGEPLMLKPVFSGDPLSIREGGGGGLASGGRD